MDELSEVGIIGQAFFVELLLGYTACLDYLGVSEPSIL